MRSSSRACDKERIIITLRGEVHITARDVCIIVTCALKFSFGLIHASIIAIPITDKVGIRLIFVRTARLSGRPDGSANRSEFDE